MDEIKFYNAVARASKGYTNDQINLSWAAVEAYGYSRDDTSEEVLKLFKKGLRLQGKPAK